MEVYPVDFDRRSFRISSGLFAEVQSYLDEMYVEERLQGPDGRRGVQAGERRPQAVLEDPQTSGLSAQQDDDAGVRRGTGTESRGNAGFHRTGGLCALAQQETRHHRGIPKMFYCVCASVGDVMRRDACPRRGIMLE